MAENDKILTKDQRMAKKAYDKVSQRRGDENFKFDEYRTLTYAFPSLIHSCGLAQAVAFAQAKGTKNDAIQRYIDDLQDVFNAAAFNKVDNVEDLKKESLEVTLSDYIRISRNALAAATWLKRYCQAMDDSANTDAE